MLKLFKLAALAGIAYAIYEIFNALTKSETAMGTVREAFAPSSRSGPAMSGATHEGAMTSVRNSDGGEHRQVVGRGVIRR